MVKCNHKKKVRLDRRSITDPCARFFLSCLKRTHNQTVPPSFPTSHSQAFSQKWDVVRLGRQTAPYLRYSIIAVDTARDGASRLTFEVQLRRCWAIICGSFLEHDLSTNKCNHLSPCVGALDQIETKIYKKSRSSLMGDGSYLPASNERMHTAERRTTEKKQKRRRKDSRLDVHFTKTAVATNVDMFFCFPSKRTVAPSSSFFETGLV